MRDTLDDPVEEDFCVAYAALELMKPGEPGHGSAAYQKARPEASLKTAQNQATTFLKRPAVRERIDFLLLQAEGADHLLRAGAMLDDLLLDTIQMAKRKDDPATLLRAVELADRGRLGGARFVKETRSRRVAESALSGKSPKEIAAMRTAALEKLGISAEDMEQFQAWKSMKAVEAGDGGEDECEGDAVGPGDRGGDPVH